MTCPESPGYVRFAINGVVFGSLDESGLENRNDPNPRSIRWSQENNIVVASIPGFVDKTQCTDRRGLWRLDVRIRTLTREKRDFLRDLGPGPHRVTTSLQSRCMYLRSKEAEQVEGEDDLTWMWNLSFIEAND
ncbi:MAG: hypothetical protein N3G75_06805 [Methanothrix sp.]|nr:hypothetical protein [Methanothrix sp.]MCX8207526.1 hypothetical protein [Methanothrix sp.]